MVEQSFEIDYLSGSTDGEPISVAATSAPGTTIHATSSGEKYLVFLTAHNDDTAPQKLYVRWGNTIDLVWELMPLEWTSVCVGWIIGNGSDVTAYGDSANVINLIGKVHQITEQ